MDKNTVIKGENRVISSQYAGHKGDQTVGRGETMAVMVDSEGHG